MDNTGVTPPVRLANMMERPDAATGHRDFNGRSSSNGERRTNKESSRKEDPCRETDVAELVCTRQESKEGDDDAKNGETRRDRCSVAPVPVVSVVAAAVGFTDATFTVMKVLEGGRNAGWPWVD